MESQPTHTHSLPATPLHSRGQQPHPNLQEPAHDMRVQLPYPPAHSALYSPCSPCPHGKSVCVSHRPSVSGLSASVIALSWPRAFAHAAAVPEGSSAFPPPSSFLSYPHVWPASQATPHPCSIYGGPDTVRGTGTRQTLTPLGWHSVTLDNQTAVCMLI